MMNVVRTRQEVRTNTGRIGMRKRHDMNELRGRICSGANKSSTHGLQPLFTIRTVTLEEKKCCSGTALPTELLELHSGSIFCCDVRNYRVPHCCSELTFAGADGEGDTCFECAMQEVAGAQSFAVVRQVLGEARPVEHLAGDRLINLYSVLSSRKTMYYSY